MAFSVFCRRNTLLVLKNLAKVGRGIKSASHRNFGKVPLPLLDHTARLADLDGIQIRDQRNTEVFIENAAQMVFGDVKMRGNLLDIRDLVIVFVDVLDHLRHATVGVIVGHVGIDRIAHRKKQLIQISRQHRLILRCTLLFRASVFHQQRMQNTGKMLAPALVRAKHERATGKQGRKRHAVR